MVFDVTVSREAFDSILKQVKNFNNTTKPYDLELELDG